MPTIRGPISPMTFATALRTPLPRKRLGSPSRSSSASRSPVDAPDGTAARPNAPLSSVTSTSTVGLPRESRISRPCTLVIFIRQTSDFRLQTSLFLTTPAAPIGLRFVPQRIGAERPYKRLVVGGHDDHARFGHGMAA